MNFALGRRDNATTDIFIEGLRAATAPQRFQITTDGFVPYKQASTGYSPPDVTHTERVPVMGHPDPAKICTSHVERQNLTIRMQMRRLTRLTNAFSRKWESLWAAYRLHLACYNFCRIHQTIRVTPAMESGITNRIWEIQDLLAA